MYTFVVAVKYERIKFLVVALKDGIEIYAWAPKPYHKFMAFKVCLRILLITLLKYLQLLLPRLVVKNVVQLEYSATC